MPDPVDLARGDGDERDRLRVGEDGLREPLALGRREALRVVHLLEEIPARAGGEPLQVEENPRGHDRAGPAGPPHLVDAGDQANATSAVVGKEGRVAHRARGGAAAVRVEPERCHAPVAIGRGLADHEHKLLRLSHDDRPEQGGARLRARPLAFKRSSRTLV